MNISLKEKVRRLTRARNRLLLLAKEAPSYVGFRDGDQTMEIPTKTQNLYECIHAVQEIVVIDEIIESLQNRINRRRAYYS